MEIRAAVEAREVDRWARAYYRTGQLDPRDWPLVWSAPERPNGMFPRRRTQDFGRMVPLTPEYGTMVNEVLLENLNGVEKMEFYYIRLILQAVAAGQRRLHRFLFYYKLSDWMTVRMNWVQILGSTKWFDTLAYALLRYSLLDQVMVHEATMAWARTADLGAPESKSISEHDQRLEQVLPAVTLVPPEYVAYLHALIATYRLTGVPEVSLSQAVGVMALVPVQPTYQDWSLGINAMNMSALSGLVGEYNQRPPTDAEVMYRLWNLVKSR